MRREYDFTKAKPNPYARKLKKPVTIRLDESTVRYFKKLAEEGKFLDKDVYTLAFMEGNSDTLEWLGVEDDRTEEEMEEEDFAGISSMFGQIFTEKDKYIMSGTDC